MEIDQIRDLLVQLTELMEEQDLTDLEVEQEGLRISLKKGGGRVVTTTAQVAPAAQHRSIPEAAAGDIPAETGLITIDSPMVGTLYRAATPNDDPYVEIGETVAEDTVVAVIEAMKVYNEIRAECEGKIVDILVGNGEAVEYGQPLFQIEPPK